jgi:hypothetical protein
MVIWCQAHEEFSGTTGELINSLEIAIKAGVPKDSQVSLDDGTLLFRWQEPLGDLGKEASHG